MDAVFNGLLAELPAILDSFLPIPQALLHRGGGWGDGGWDNACQNFTTDANGPKWGPFVLKIPQKVAKSMANFTVVSCGHS